MFGAHVHNLWCIKVMSIYSFGEYVVHKMVLITKILAYKVSHFVLLPSHLDVNNFQYVPLSVQGKSHLPLVRDL